MKINKGRLLFIIGSIAFVATAGVAIFFITRNHSSPTRYHDSWMPSDIDWTVYVGGQEPESSRGFNDDYFVVRNTWRTYRKQNNSWNYVGNLVELDGVEDDSIYWVNQLYSLYCKENKWYKGSANEWAYDLRDGYLFKTTYYDIHFYGEKSENTEDNIIDYGVQKAKRRESISYDGSTPIKPFDDEYFYSFDAWDHNLNNITESFDTYATFSKYENGSLVKKGKDGTYNIGFDEDDEIKREITSIDIPDSINGQPVKKIDEGAFSECINLEYVKLPETIESIGEHAFFACRSLREITIPKNVTSISEVAFSSSLVSLKAIYVEEGNPNYKDVDGILYTIDGKTIIKYPPAKENDESTFTIDDKVEYISSFCFSDFSDVEEFVFPTNLKQIGTWAFKSTNITKLEIPKDCRILSGNFVSGCANLEEIDVADDSEYYKSIDGVLYTKDQKEIYRIAEGKDLSDGFEIPDYVTSLGTYCFSNTSISSIKIPANVKNIRMYCFSYLENLNNIYIPNSIEKIASRAFYSSHNLIIDCEELEEPETWATDWAYVRDYSDLSDQGYVKEIHWGVEK